MKYLVIYGGEMIEKHDMEVWDFKGDDLSIFMEEFAFDDVPPIVIPVTMVKDVLAKKGVHTIKGAIR